MRRERAEDFELFRRQHCKEESMRPLRGPRARHVGKVDVGTWDIPRKRCKMQKHETKKDNFKMIAILPREVRLAHSSGEVR